MVKRSNRFTSKTALNITGAQARKMSRDELAQAVSALASAGNKRIKRLAQAGQPIEDNVERFSVAGKNKNELMRELRRARNFMQAENQSLRGQARIAREAFKGMARVELGTDASKASITKRAKDFADVLGTDTKKGSRYYRFWKAYDRLKELNPILENAPYKYRMLQEQIKIMKGNPRISKARLVERMDSLVKKVYGDVQEEIIREMPKDGFTF